MQLEEGYTLSLHKVTEKIVRATVRNDEDTISFSDGFDKKSPLSTVIEWAERRIDELEKIFKEMDEIEL